MNHKQSRKLRRLIDSYCEARIENAWKGSYELEDRDLIRENFEIETGRLDAYLKELTNETK